MHFFTDIRDHWSQNGILKYLTEWRKLCDDSRNSILWISTEDNGRQSWLTEFSINLIDICRSQGQLVTFSMCDRPKGTRWTPQQVLKQLILQLLSSRPALTVSAPEVFNTRRFRKAETFDSVFKLLCAAVAILGSVVFVIDRLDKCTRDLAARHTDIAEVLSMLVKKHPRSVRIIVTSGQIVSPPMLPCLPISFAVVSTKRRPRLLEYKSSWGKRKAENNDKYARIPPPPDRLETKSIPADTSSYRRAMIKINPRIYRDDEESYGRGRRYSYEEYKADE